MDQDKLKSKKKRIAIFAALVAVVAVAGLWWWIRYAGVVSTDDARVKGTIVTVSSRATGRIDELLVNEGEAVQAGQIIARLDSRDLEAKVAQAKANLTAAQAKLAGTQAGNRPQQIAQAEAAAVQASANLENAQKQYDRAKVLYHQGAISAQQLDTMQTALAVAQAQYTGSNQSLNLTAEGSRPEDIQVAQAQVEQAAAALKDAEVQLSDATIKAPLAGIVAQRSVHVGESVSVGQPMFNIADHSDVWVSANIDENQVGKLRLGQSADITIDAYPGQRLPGTLYEIGAATGSQFSLLPTENTSGNYTKVTQKIPIKIKVPANGSFILKPGMSAIIAVHVR